MRSPVPAGRLVSAAIARLWWPLGVILVMPAALDLGHVLGVVTVVAIAVATAHVLRWRISGGEREAALRVPSSGTMPLNDGVGLVVAVVVLARFALGARSGLAVVGPWLLVGPASLDSPTGLPLAVIAALAVVWSGLLSRPSLVAPAARQAGLEPATLATWARATLVSTVLLVAAAALDAFATATVRGAAALATPVLVMVATAVVLDIIDDARAHRTALAPAGVLHRIQLADVVEGALADAGIPCHIRAGNLRTLLAFFGPWAPAIVLVPEARADDARRTIDDLLRAANVARMPIADDASAHALEMPRKPS
jgi:hypothetical protein